MKYLIFIASIFVLGSCESNQKEKWIVGSKNDQMSIIEKHFRGFDMAMVETGYRYQELFWAGQDQNWEYASYQVNKMEKTLKNGLERRPNRVQSAEHFLTEVLPQMKASIGRQDTAHFNQTFKTLTTNCNACHTMENVAFFTVKTPLNRMSPIR